MGETSKDLDAAIHKAADLVLGSQHVVGLVGAGMSVESGIPPFRGSGGLWTRCGEPTSLSYQKFINDPGAWWEERRKSEEEPGNPTHELKIAVDAAEPNPGHYALAELERMGLLKCLITQNVDGLHTRAGSVSVAEIHGNRTMLRCLDCGIRLPSDGFPVIDIPPRCRECGGTLKIDTAMFGEPIRPAVLAICVEHAEICDCMLMIGTSGTVHPTASLPMAAKSRGAALIEINPHETSLTPAADLVLCGSSGEILPVLVATIRERHRSAQ